MQGCSHACYHILLLMSVCTWDRCAAVQCIDGEHHYTDGPPAAKLMESFQKRCDNQITTLEILAISVGLSTFCDKLSGRKVVIFGDNTGAEASVRKGASRAWDQCQLIHEIWTLVLYQLCLCSFGNQKVIALCQALMQHMHLWIERVSSEDNISDLPSREQYDLMYCLGAQWRSPTVAKLFLT